MAHWIGRRIGGYGRPIDSTFEIGGGGRSLPLEGLRGVAVGVVFLHHYCMQFSAYGSISGFTAQFATVFRNFGGYGVELFFVLSGFLIYGILIRRKPLFILFMTRRARRLYPVFMVVFVIAIFWDFIRPEPKIPDDPNNAIIYLVENMPFIPGLFPVEPLFVVNWSLSFEWWFYLTATFLFSVCRLATLPACYRINLIIAASAILYGLAASGLPHVPYRGLGLLGGMLVAEASAGNWRPRHGGWATSVATISLLFYIVVPLSILSCELVITLSFCFLCFAALAGYPAITVPLSWKYLRWFGNISYSYYLIHAFIVVVCVRGITKFVGAETQNVMFWVALLPVFAAGVCAGAVLFLCVEKPYSFQQRGIHMTAEPVPQAR
jgi:exopolysaccharide production protein ExoZ